MKIYKISQEVKEIEDSEEDSDISLVGISPNNSNRSCAPVNWNEKDIQMLRAWNEKTVREFLGLQEDSVIYRAFVDISNLSESLVEEDAEEDLAYDWSELSMGRTNPPPIVVTRKTNERLIINDGNHRVRFWRENGYLRVPAWVYDELITEYNRKNKIEKYRIIQ